MRLSKLTATSPRGQTSSGGYGTGSVTLTEEASLNGACGIINETGGKVDVSVPLDNLNFAYKGNTNGSLTIKDTAVLGANSEISNNTKGRITIYGKLKENSKINLEGNSAGYFVFGEHGV